MNNYFSTHSVNFLLSIGILGLIVGSFLNVVIYRLPLMNYVSRDQAINLWTPRSFCPLCNVSIPFYLNIPILSYLMLLGRSCCCSERIPIHYPLVEAITALTFLYLGLIMGPTLQFAMSATLVSGLLALSFIDSKTLTLPDQITLPFILLGFINNYFAIFCSLLDAFLGCIVGYLSFLLIERGGYLIRGKAVLGRGDCKLIAMLGAWLGLKTVPFIVFIGSLIGSVFGILYIIITRQKFTIKFPFGPFLACAGLIALIFGERTFT